MDYRESGRVLSFFFISGVWRKADTSGSEWWEVKAEEIPGADILSRD